MLQALVQSSSHRMPSRVAHVRSSYVGNSRIELSTPSSIFLDNSVRFVKILRDFSNTAPCIPLSATCSIALTILQCIQTTLKLNEDYLYLGQRIAELVAGICTECQRQWDSGLEISSHVKDKIKTLLGHLEEIYRFIRKQTKANFFVRILKSQELKDSLDRCNKRLDDASRLFDVTSMISIQQTLETIKASSPTTGSDRYILTSDKIERDDYAYRTTQKYTVTRGKCFRKQRWITALVKSYPSSADKLDFNQEIRFAKKIKHPNLHELLGYHSEDDEDIVVYSGVSSSVSLYLDEELRCGDPLMSFCVVAKMLQGIASGLQYLRFHTQLTKTELEECGKVNNCVIGAHGNIIIGHNLIVEDDRKCLQPVYKDCDEWLKEMFYMIGSELIYGPVKPDWSDWDWVTASRSMNGELTRHTRILENVFCFLQPTFSALVTDLEKISDCLRAIVPSDSRAASLQIMPKDNHDKPVEFQRVRDVLLEIRNGQIYYIYRPPTPLDVRVLDIGYIRPSDGKFVRIDSYRGLLALGPVVHPPPILIGAKRCETSSVPGHKGILKHRFHQPNYATVRRMTACEAMPDTETKRAWRLFAKDARRLYDEHSPMHPEMKIQDLILVTKIETDLRFSILAWSADDDGTLEPPSTVQYVDFYEYEKVEFGKPWGYWVIDDAQGDEWVGSEIKETRCAQNIMFLQLEAADLAPESKL